MLSYAKHGKFPALTQAARPESQRKIALFGPTTSRSPRSALAVDHGMQSTANAPPRRRGDNLRTGALRAWLRPPVRRRRTVPHRVLTPSAISA